MVTKAEQKAKALKAAIAYEDGLYSDLKDQNFAIQYLNAAMEENNADLFLIALRDVVKAQEGGVAHVAETTHLSRQNLYTMLSKKGNPRLQNLVSVLQSLGLSLQIRPYLSNGFWYVTGNVIKANNI